MAATSAGATGTLSPAALAFALAQNSAQQQSERLLKTQTSNAVVVALLGLNSQFIIQLGDPALAMFVNRPDYCKVLQAQENFLKTLDS
jgi:hypothetical protein